MTPRETTEKLAMEHRQRLLRAVEAQRRVRLAAAWLIWCLGMIAACTLLALFVQVGRRILENRP